ncbi:MAG: hypothetical protein ACI35W_06975 [Anaeroplasmataceae bacterium]
MKKFLKNNKLPIFLLLCVVMLSVFYAFSPSETSDNSKTVGNIPSDNYYYFDEERLSILEERNIKIKEIESSVATSNLGLADISSKMSLIEEIYSITNKECSLEVEIESLGYDDVLVYSYEETENIGNTTVVCKCVDVKILATELKKERAVVITQLTKTKFGNNDYKVSLILESNNLV